MRAALAGLADGLCWALAVALCLPVAAFCALGTLVALAWDALGSALCPLWERMGRVADWMLDRCWWI